MPLGPKTTKRSFSNDSAIKKYRTPKPPSSISRRTQRTNFWPGGKLDYEFLESCKEFICSVPHPTAYYKHKGREYRLSILRWSRGSYIDLRMYTADGKPTPTGILLHIDIADKLLPEIVDAVRKMVLEDTREVSQRASVIVRYKQDEEDAETPEP